MITNNDIVRLVLTWLLNSETVVQQVWHYIKDAGSDQDPADVLDDMLTEHDQHWIAHVQDHVTDDLEGVEGELFLWDSVAGEFNQVATAAHTMDGAAVGDRYAPGVAGLVHFYASKPRYNGAKYVAGITEGGIGNGIVTGTVTTALALWLLDVAVSWVLTGSTYTPGVFNQAAARWNDFTGSGLVSANPAYQRRRRTGVGI